MKIIGLRIEKYIDKEVSGYNCDFEYKDAEFQRHIICGVLSDNRKVEIELSRSEGECGSGWSVASWGNIEVIEVSKFNGYTHVPKKPLNIADIEPSFNDDISNEVFSVSSYGGDEYYPCGGYNVEMGLFKETSRSKDLRPVWIFKGKSNTGKSFLASKLKDVAIYETDRNEFLPDSITETIIVLGNKYPFTVEQIEEKLFGEVEVNIVEFN
jgi:hypothetical protein